MPARTQYSFSSGVLSPSFWGRKDHRRYSTGVKDAVNCVVTQTGSLRKRTGFRRASGLYPPGALTPRGDYRLFRIGSAFGDSICALYRTAVCVFGNGTLDPAIVQLPRAITYEEMERCQFVQCGDVVHMVFGGGSRQMDMTISATQQITVANRPGIAFDSFTDPSTGGFTTDVRVLFRVTDSDFEFSIGADSWKCHKEQYYALQNFGEQYPKQDADHPYLPWEIKVTFIHRQAFRGEFEADSDIVMKYESLPAYIDWMKLQVCVQKPEGHDDIVGMRVYRGRNGVFALVGEARVTEPCPAYLTHSPLVPGEFVTGGGDGQFFVVVDDCGTPDISHQPPAPVEPGSPYAPDALCYFQQRQFTGGDIGAPGKLMASRTGQPYEFVKNPYLEPLASDGMSLTLASTEREHIVSMVPMNGRLLVMTNKNLWACGSQGAAMSPSDAQAVCYSGVGASRLQPIQLRNTVVFVGSSGNEVFEVRQDQNSMQWATRELGQYSRHLLDGHRIVDWCYSSTPDPVIWMVREDGVLLSMSYRPEADLVAWTRHELPWKARSIACADGSAVWADLGGNICVMDATLPSRYLDGERTVTGMSAANATKLKLWKPFDATSATMTKQEVCGVPVEADATTETILCGNPVVMSVSMLDAVSYGDVGLRPKTLKKLALDHIGAGEPAISEGDGRHASPERPTRKVERRISWAHVTHSYDVEAAGTIVSSVPMAEMFLGVAQEIDLGDPDLRQA
ncbi:MAG: hypothetical protein MJ058_04110 [Akkermansia sp.]|nr:hypothetical protein [Akkermansia sp.]